MKGQGIRMEKQFMITEILRQLDATQFEFNELYEEEPYESYHDDSAMIRELKRKIVHDESLSKEEAYALLQFLAPGNDLFHQIKASFIDLYITEKEIDEQNQLRGDGELLKRFNEAMGLTSKFPLQ